MATVNVGITVPFQEAFVEITGDRQVQIGVTVPFQSMDANITTPNIEPTIGITVPFQSSFLGIGEVPDALMAIGLTVPFQQSQLDITGAPVTTFIAAALLSKIGSFANEGAVMDPGPLAFSSQLTCIVSEL